MKSWNKGSFRSKHREELSRYDESVKFFRENAGGNIPSMKDLKGKKELLQSQKQKQLESQTNLQRSWKNLQTAISNVEAILGNANSLVQTTQHSKQSSKHPLRNNEPSL